MADKKKFRVKHGLEVNTQSGSTQVLKYPTADGELNQVIKTDGNGNLSFDSLGGGGGGTFISLSDTPIAYTGGAGRALVVNDSGNALVFSQNPVSSSLNRHQFTGTGSQTRFAMGTAYAGQNYVLVFVDGVIQYPTTNFALDSVDIVFTSAPLANADIVIMGTVTAAGFPSGSVDSNSLSNPLTTPGALTVKGHLLPHADSTYDLGSPSAKWKDLYMSGSTIHMGPTGKMIKADSSGIILPTGSRVAGGDRLVSYDSYNSGNIAGAGAITSFSATNTLGTAGLQIGAQGNVLFAPSITNAQIFSNPVHNDGGIDFSDLHIKAGLNLRLYAGNTATFNTDINLETGHKIIFEGSTNDSFETMLLVTDPTADNTITFPDASGTVLTADANNYVGIGVPSPQYALDIEGNSFAKSTIRLTRTDAGADNDAGIYFRNNAGANNDYGMGGIWFINTEDDNAYAMIRARTNDATGTSGKLEFITGASAVGNGTDPRMTIDRNGNVGINTEPANVFHLQGLQISSGGGYSVMRLDDTTAYDGTAPGAGISFRGKYNSSGSTTNFACIQGIKENTTDGNYASAFNIKTRANGGNLTEQFRIKSDGHVMIDKGLFVGNIAGTSANDEIRATSNITAYYSSDERLKENIVPITNAIDKINSIRGVEFDWTDENIEKRGGEDGYFVQKHDVGVIAQEVEKVLPEVVKNRDDGYKGVMYEKMVPLLIEAIKEQQKQIDELKDRLDNA